MSEELERGVLSRATKLAGEWVACFDSNGEACEPAHPHLADWARVIVAMAGVCNVIRLEMATLPSRHRRERIGDPRLHRIFDAVDALDAQGSIEALTKRESSGHSCPHDMQPSARLRGFLECPKCGLARLAPGPERSAMETARSTWNAENDGIAAVLSAPMPAATCTPQGEKERT